jgi:hypothetical protein
MGYEFLQADDVDSVAAGLIPQMDKAGASLIVDYSCMPASELSSVLSAISNASGSPANGDQGRLEVCFAYAPAGYSDPLPDTPVESIGPIDNHWRLQLPGRETALIIDLGNRENPARALVDNLDPAVVHLFHANGFPDPDFLDAVLDGNASLIDHLGSDRLMAYSLDNLGAAYKALELLCMELCEKYHVIVAPLGPKPFSLVVQLLSVRMPIIDVWQAKTPSSDVPIDRPPLGPVTICKAGFD